MLLKPKAYWNPIKDPIMSHGTQNYTIWDYIYRCFTRFFWIMLQVKKWTKRLPRNQRAKLVSGPVKLKWPSLVFLVLKKKSVSSEESGASWIWRLFSPDSSQSCFSFFRRGQTFPSSSWAAAAGPTHRFFLLSQVFSSLLCGRNQFFNLPAKTDGKLKGGLMCHVLLSEVVMFHICV